MKSATTAGLSRQQTRRRTVRSRRWWRPRPRCGFSGHSGGLPCEGAWSRSWHRHAALVAFDQHGSQGFEQAQLFVHGSGAPRSSCISTQRSFDSISTASRQPRGGATSPASLSRSKPWCGSLITDTRRSRPVNSGISFRPGGWCCRNRTNRRNQEDLHRDIAPRRELSPEGYNRAPPATLTSSAAGAAAAGLSREGHRVGLGAGAGASAALRHNHLAIGLGRSCGSQITARQKWSRSLR